MVLLDSSQIHSLPGERMDGGTEGLSVGEAGWERDVVIHLNPYQHHVSGTVCLLGARKHLAYCRGLLCQNNLWRLMYLPIFS